MDIPAAGRPCLEEPALLVEGLDGGSGVLVWLAPGGGADTGRFAILAPTGDTAVRHARVVLRYNPGDEPHAFALDSGAVVWRREGDRAGGTVAGTGYDAVGGVRPQVQGALRDVVIESTAVACGAAP